MQVITRDQAVAKGLLRYFTGEPCANGHISERYVKGYVCKECASPLRPRVSFKVRRKQILTVAVGIAARPGGWTALTRCVIAKEVGCSEGLISRYLGNMVTVRKAIAKVAKRESIQSIITQSVVANDGYIR